MWERKQAQRFARRRTVNDDKVIKPFPVVLLQPQKCGSLLHAGQGGRLLRNYIFHALKAEGGQHKLPDVFPVLFHGIVDIHLLSEEVRGNLLRLGGELLIKGIGKAVGGVSGKDECLGAGLSSLQSCCRSQCGLSYASLSGEEHNAHSFEI